MTETCWCLVFSSQCKLEQVRLTYWKWMHLRLLLRSMLCECNTVFPQHYFVMELVSNYFVRIVRRDRKARGRALRWWDECPHVVSLQYDHRKEFYQSENQSLFNTLLQSHKHSDFKSLFEGFNDFVGLTFYLTYYSTLEYEYLIILYIGRATPALCALQPSNSWHYHARSFVWGLAAEYQFNRNLDFFLS